MVDLFATLLVALAATNGPAAGVDRAAGQPPFAVGVALPGQEVETAYRQLLALDDQAQEEIDAWIREADRLGAAAADDAAALQKRVDDKIAEVSRAYLDFLGKHPDHARARVAFGSFLNDTGQEFPAREQWEKALQLDPKNPAIYNNLAGSYGHRGPVTNALALYEKAIELDPTESLYYHNFATTVFLFRRDVMEYYSLTNEQLVFDKALALYHKAQELAPDNFVLATDLAQTFYGIRPPRHAEALAAWQRALGLASDDLERQGIRIHLARVQIQSGDFAAARAQLTQVTNTNYEVVKGRLERLMETKLKGEAVPKEEAPEGGPAARTSATPSPAVKASPPPP